MGSMAVGSLGSLMGFRQARGGQFGATLGSLAGVVEQGEERSRHGSGKGSQAETRESSGAAAVGSGAGVRGREATSRKRRS